MPQSKSRVAYGLLAIFLGGLGVHRFYLGQYLPGVFYFLFSWTLIPLLFGLGEGVIALVKNDDWFQAKLDAIAAANERKAALAAERAAKAEAARQAKIEALVAEHGAWAEHVINKQIKIGMPRHSLIAAWGKPAAVKENRSTTYYKEKYYYGAYTNSQRKTSYKREVSLQDGVVTAIKDI